MATCSQPWQKSRKTGETRCQVWYLSWVETRTCWTPIIECTTIGLCLSRHDAAEVYSLEVHRHAETNPTCFLNCACGDYIKIGWKETKHWNYSTKKSIWEKPTFFLDHVYLGCTQRQCEVSQNIVDNHRTMFESRISAGRTEKFLYSENIRISSWSYDMEGHAKKCVGRYCELANKTTQQLYKVSTPCIDDHHFKEEMKSVGEMSQVCSQVLYLARIGRPDILWSVNQFARSITKWTKACDKTLGSINYIHSSHMWIQTVLLCG